MKIQWKPLILCIAVPLLVGGLSAILTQGGMEAFNRVNKPPLSPPNWLFPVVWTILFTLMGLASYLVLTADKPWLTIRTALIVYGAQLAVNFCWSIFFFNLGLYLFSFIWLLGLWLLIGATVILFYRVVKTAGYLLTPYLLWVAFAGYLNFAVYLLN